jgi:AraC-like DNA-binding protein
VLESRIHTEIATEALVETGSSGIMLILANPYGAVQDGEVGHVGEVLVYGPGADCTAHGRGEVSLQLGMPARELARQLRALLGDEAPDLTGRRFRIRLGRVEAGRLARVLRRALERAPTETVAPPAGGGLAPDAQEIVSSACEIVAGGWPSRVRPPSLRRDRERLFRAARDLIGVSHGALDLTSLCEHLGVSAETLRLVFREFVGLPPMKYGKLQRLHAARERLKTADPRVDNVKSIARRCGVRHLGRFSVEYREVFGERPSDTLRAVQSI